VGPLTSFALALAFWGLGRLLPENAPALASAVIGYLAWVNAALGVFNLLPGFPLDGGRVLRALLWWRTGSLRRATRTAADAGKGLAVGLMLLGGVEVFLGSLVPGLWLIFIGMFLRTMAEASYRSLVLLQTFEDMTVEDLAIREPVTVEPDLCLRRLVDEYVLPRGHRAFPVVEAGVVKGLISIEDLRDVPREEWASTTVKARMTPLAPQIRVAPDTPLADALKQITAARPGRLLVMHGDELVGMLTRGGLARFLDIRHALDET
jgi:CBS domain-containing protein